VSAEPRFGQEGFTAPAPRRPFRADLAQLRAAAFMAMIFVTAQVREGDVFQRPEKVYAYTFPRLFVFDTQLLGSRNYFRALEANVLPVLAQNVEENHFAQTVTCRPVRHT
jgi:hypothetical protein